MQVGAYLAQQQAGSSVSLDLLREGKELSVLLT
jgi:hypothetical protein